MVVQAFASRQARLTHFYRRRGFSGRVGFGTTPALLVVDLILGFTDPASPLGADLDAPVAATCQLLAAARSRRIPVLFTTVEYEPGLADAGLFPRKAAGLKWLVTGSPWIELDRRMQRTKGELLLRKKYASAFFGTSLSSWLTTQRVDTLILAGCTTSGCVRATAVDALQYGFRTIVPREAVGDRAPSPHEASLFDIDAKYGDVVAVPEVLAYFARISRSAARQRERTA